MPESPMFLLYADLQPEGLAALDAAPTEEAARVILSELLGLRWATCGKRCCSSCT